METILFDGHCDTLSRCLSTGEGLERNTGHLDLERTKGFGRWAQFFAVFGEGGYGDYLAQTALFSRWMERYPDRIRLCRTGEEAEETTQEGKCAAFLSVEGGELLECSLVRLREAYDFGVRAVNLTWNHANRLSGSNAEETERGLSSEGKAFVGEMTRLGMLVDVSHLSDPGFWDVERLVPGPFFASHSDAREVFYHPRNLTDGQFTAIIKHGGVAGLNFFPDFLGENAGVDHVIAHLEHFLALGGEKNVAIGSDFDGISRTPRGLRDIGDLNGLYETLLKRNYQEALVRDLFYYNMMRVVKTICTTSVPETKR